MPTLKFSKEDGLEAIYNALAWLTQNGLTDHIVERLDEYPILRVHSQRDILSTHCATCNHDLCGYDCAIKHQELTGHYLTHLIS